MNQPSTTDTPMANLNIDPDLFEDDFWDDFDHDFYDYDDILDSDDPDYVDEDFEND